MKNPKSSKSKIRCESKYCKTKPTMVDNTDTYKRGYAYKCPSCGAMIGCDDDIIRK